MNLPVANQADESASGREAGLVNRACLLGLVLMLLAAVGRAQDGSPYLFVLGIAQDGGYPQAGCFAEHCMPGWQNPAARRHATSLAVIDPATGQRTLFEATPDFPAQLHALEREAPGKTSAPAAIFLTHAHIGHYAGLMFLGREVMGTHRVPVYAMERLRDFLAANGPWSQLVELQNIDLRGLVAGRGEKVGKITVTPFLVPHRDEFSETVGYRIDGPSRSALFIPDIDKWSDWDTNIAELVRTVDYALVDATFFADGELQGRDMSKIRHPFVTESMAVFAGLSPAERSRVWFIHMNHSNPLLNPDSEQAKQVRNSGFNIASEGLRLRL